MPTITEATTPSTAMNIVIVNKKSNKEDKDVRELNGRNEERQDHAESDRKNDRNFRKRDEREDVRQARFYGVGNVYDTERVFSR